jgi:hypothetical protein
VSCGEILSQIEVFVGESSYKGDFECSARIFSRRREVKVFSRVTITGGRLFFSWLTYVRDACTYNRHCRSEEILRYFIRRRFSPSPPSPPNTRPNDSAFIEQLCCKLIVALSIFSIILMPRVIISSLRVARLLLMVLAIFFQNFLSTFGTKISHL